MRISQLSDATGVPVPTLKFYLREGLLHPGEQTSRTQARYDESHAERVRLIRALSEAGGLSLARVRQVLDALGDPPSSRHHLLGAAQDALTPDGTTCDPEWSAFARGFVDRRGWQIRDDEPLIDLLGGQLHALAEAGIEVDDGAPLMAWADAAESIADADLSTVPDDPAAALRQVVVGTVLTDPVLATLRRLAQQHRSATLFEEK
ncbi:MerR family transcriptional regulator [Flexivirga sp. ID2601S]|uniref:MerR family transcriptional regulator n=1 Tax=Flexivirga aerilata TaxID=1656889 RepID=A0A849AIT4_9MICO|nr:MerR family transcriptional regulator [Flexivirga aerilata]NNG40299.1 MerR family transcriptional regulator [Flexivirga aerilata]